MIRQFANHGRMGGGYSAVDMALHDIAGKVYGVPAYRLIGNKNHDQIRIYADTTSHPDPKVYAERMRKRKEMGLTFFKMDLQSDMLRDRKDPSGALNERGVCTEKGLGYLCEYIAAIRDVIGPGTPLAADHFGPLNVNDSIRYARAFEPYQLSWAEDLLQIPEGDQYPYLNWQAYKTISDATVTPVLTGEDIFGLQGGFQELIDHRAWTPSIPTSKLPAGCSRPRGLPTMPKCTASGWPCIMPVRPSAAWRAIIVQLHSATTTWRWKITPWICRGGRIWLPVFPSRSSTRVT